MQNAKMWKHIWQKPSTNIFQSKARNDRKMAYTLCQNCTLCTEDPHISHTPQPCTHMHTPQHGHTKTHSWNVSGGRASWGLAQKEMTFFFGFSSFFCICHFFRCFLLETVTSCGSLRTLLSQAAGALPSGGAWGMSFNDTILTDKLRKLNSTQQPSLGAWGPE